MVNMKIKSRNYILLLTAILLIVAFFGVTGAWFTQTQSVKMNGRVAYAGGTVSCNGGLTNNSTYYTLNSYTRTSDIVTQPTLTVNSTSTINAYLRARIEINWTPVNDEINNGYGSVFDYVDFNLADAWYARNTEITDDNAKIQSGWLYYMYLDNAELKLKEIKAQNVIDDLDTAQLLSGITIKNSMPSTVKIKVFVEFVEANSLGSAKFGFVQS